jgi:hypothetical protein
VSAHPIRATLAGILLFVIGLAIGAGAFENYRRERAQLAAWVRADGQVVQVLSLQGGRTRAVVTFTTFGGDRIRFTASPPRAGAYKIGDAVRVLYPAADPFAAIIESPVLRWGRIVYAGGGSLLLMALGAYVAWTARRH